MQSFHIILLVKVLAIAVANDALILQDSMLKSFDMENILYGAHTKMCRKSLSTNLSTTLS